MTVIHFSDTHLGFNDLDKINSDGINQREADFYDAFEQVVAQIKALKPNYIIHTGDLFHRASPSNRAISFALSQFKILDSLNIPIIIIAGNHSTPKTYFSSPILKIFETFENVHIAYNEEYKKVEFENIIFHCLPHMNDSSKALSQIELCEKGINASKKNIMLMHCSVSSHYLMQEFGEWVYPKDKEYIFSKMDYVALGHWHGFGKVGKFDNVYYSGSTERTNLGDKRDSKGFVVADLKDKLEVSYKEIKLRPMLEFAIDCANWQNSIDSLDVSNIKDAIVDVRLINLTTLQSIDINTNDIKKLFDGAMYVNVKREFKTDENTQTIDGIESFSLENYFLEHIKTSTKNEEFERLELKIKELFSTYDEAYSDTE